MGSGSVQGAALGSRAVGESAAFAKTTEGASHSAYSVHDTERPSPEEHYSRRSDFARDRARLLHSGALRTTTLWPCGVQGLQASALIGPEMVIIGVPAADDFLEVTGNEVVSLMAEVP